MRNPTRIQSHGGVAGGMLSALADSMDDSVTVVMAPSDRYSSCVATSWLKSDHPIAREVSPLVPQKSSGTNA